MVSTSCLLCDLYRVGANSKRKQTYIPLSACSIPKDLYTLVGAQVLGPNTVTCTRHQTTINLTEVNNWTTLWSWWQLKFNLSLIIKLLAGKSCGTCMLISPWFPIKNMDMNCHAAHKNVLFTTMPDEHDSLDIDIFPCEVDFYVVEREIDKTGYADQSITNIT